MIRSVLATIDLIVLLLRTKASFTEGVIKVIYYRNRGERS